MIATFLSILRRALAAMSTLLLVTAIACLVWLYAVQQNVRDQELPGLSLRFGSDDQRRDYLITTEMPSKTGVSFRVSNSQFDLIRQNIKSGGGSVVIPLNIDPQEKRPIFDILVNVKDSLQATAFKDAGATNLKTPEVGETIKVTAERMVTVDLPLEEHHDPIRIPQPPTLGVSHVKVRLPARLAAKLAGTKALADIDNIKNLGAATPGLPFTGNVDIKIPALAAECATEAMRDQNHITLEPAMASVTLTPEKTTAEYKVAPLTINISAPAALLEKWNFEIRGDGKNFLSDLILVGSREAIEAVAANEKGTDKKPKSVWAAVRVTLEDTDKDHMPPNGDLEKEVEIILPPGASRVKPEILPKVTVHATRRNAN